MIDILHLIVDKLPIHDKEKAELHDKLKEFEPVKEESGDSGNG